MFKTVNFLCLSNKSNMFASIPSVYTAEINENTRLTITLSHLNLIPPEAESKVV